MKKYSILGTALLMQTISCFDANSMGPVPLPYPGYQPNPSYNMNSQQRYAIQQAFIWAQNAFQTNHTMCRNRGECLKLDFQSLNSYITKYPYQPATPFFQNIYSIIRNDSVHQKFVSQWVVFQYLSSTAQLQYRQGLRITPIQPQYVTNFAGMQTPAFFNQDDVLIDLLQHIDHAHKNCDQYITCLRGDLQLVKNLYNRLTPADPVRYTLKGVYQNISNLATTSMFDTLTYLNLYNPISSSWSDLRKKHKAKKLVSYGYSQWKGVEKGSRATTWRAPRFTNGSSTTGVYSTQSGLYGIPQYSTPPVPSGKQNWWDKHKGWLKYNSEYIKNFW